jgi:hypothetical protein
MWNAAARCCSTSALAERALGREGDRHGRSCPGAPCLLARHWSLERLQKSIRCNEGEGPTQRRRFFCAKRCFEAFLSTRPRALRLDDLSAPGSCECDEPIAPVSGISNGLDETIPFKWLYVVRQRAAVHDKSSGQFTHCGCSHTKDLIQNRQLRHTKAAGCKRLVIELRHASRCFSQRRAITAVLRLSKARPHGPLNGLGHSRLPHVAPRSHGGRVDLSTCKVVGAPNNLHVQAS